MSPFVSRTVGDVVSEMIMSRTTFSGSFLVVEGETDSKFFSRHVARDHGQLVIAGGKPTVCGAVEKAYNDGQTGILGIVDDDCDSVCGFPLTSDHIVRTDARDVEALLLRSSALELVLRELGDHTRISTFEATEGCTVRDALVSRSLIFGMLRLLDKRNHWNLKLRDFNPYRFADYDDWRIDEDGLIALASERLELPSADIARSIAEVSVEDPFLVLHGRTTVAVLAVGLRKRLGHQQYSVEELSQMLRLAFDHAMANECAMFHEIRKWETANAPYRVLI